MKHLPKAPPANTPAARRLALSLALAAIATTFTACNTTRGVGKDVEDAGSGLKHSAERHGAD
jgi:predicted small secreted protein